MNDTMSVRPGVDCRSNNARIWLVAPTSRAPMTACMIVNERSSIPRMMTAWGETLDANANASRTSAPTSDR